MCANIWFIMGPGFHLSFPEFGLELPLQTLRGVYHL